MAKVSTAKDVYSRNEFVEKYMRQGFSYREAVSAYKATCELFGDAIMAGAKINIGNVCTLNPQWRNPREVKMHFTREKRDGKIVVTSNQRTYHLDRRLSYTMKIFDSFKNSHPFHWYT